MASFGSLLKPKVEQQGVQVLESNVGVGSALQNLAKELLLFPHLFLLYDTRRSRCDPCAKGSPMPKRSSLSAGATYLDKEERIEQLRQAAVRAQKRAPEIKRVILFGSIVTGIPSPRSDADLLIVVEASPHRHSRDRFAGSASRTSPTPVCRRPPCADTRGGGSLSTGGVTTAANRPHHRPGSPLRGLIAPAAAAGG